MRAISVKDPISSLTKDVAKSVVSTPFTCREQVLPQKLTPTEALCFR